VVAGVVYFASVFAAGFVLGTIRVLALEPRIGELTAGLIELPIILGFAWVLCGRLVKRFAVPSDGGLRLWMGAVAFGLLMVAELVLSVSLFGQAPSEVLTGWMTPSGAIGLAGQVLFGFFPLLRR